MSTNDVEARSASFSSSARAASAPAFAQSRSAPSGCGSAPGTRQLFTGTIGDFRQLPSRGSLGIMTLGTAAAIGTHAVDARRLAPSRARQSCAARSSLAPCSAAPRCRWVPRLRATRLAAHSQAVCRQRRSGSRAGAAGRTGADLCIERHDPPAKARRQGLFVPIGPHHRLFRVGHRGFQQHFGWKIGLPGLRRRLVRRRVASPDETSLPERCDLRCCARDHGGPDGVDWARPAVAHHADGHGRGAAAGFTWVGRR